MLYTTPYFTSDDDKHVDHKYFDGGDTFTIFGDGIEYKTDDDLPFLDEERSRIRYLLYWTMGKYIIASDEIINDTSLISVNIIIFSAEKSGIIRERAMFFDNNTDVYNLICNGDKLSKLIALTICYLFADTGSWSLGELDWIKRDNCSYRCKGGKIQISADNSSAQFNKYALSCITFDPLSGVLMDQVCDCENIYEGIIPHEGTHFIDVYQARNGYIVKDSIEVSYHNYTYDATTLSYRILNTRQCYKLSYIVQPLPLLDICIKFVTNMLDKMPRDVRDKILIKYK